MNGGGFNSSLFLYKPGFVGMLITCIITTKLSQHTSTGTPPLVHATAQAAHACAIVINDCLHPKHRVYLAKPNCRGRECWWRHTQTVALKPALYPRKAMTVLWEPALALSTCIASRCSSCKNINNQFIRSRGCNKRDHRVGWPKSHRQKSQSEMWQWTRDLQPTGFKLVW